MIKDLTLENILYKQIVKENPDIIFFQNTHFLSKIFDKILDINFFLRWNRRNNIKIAKDSIGVLTCLKKSMIFYKKNMKLKVYICRIHLIKKILEKIKVKNFSSRKYDLVYSGSIDNKGHFNRVIFL